MTSLAGRTAIVTGGAEGQIDVGDLRVEADEWLIWLDRRFDRRAANERLRTLAR